MLRFATWGPQPPYPQPGESGLNGGFHAHLTARRFQVLDARHGLFMHYAHIVPERRINRIDMPLNGEQPSRNSAVPDSIKHHLKNGFQLQQPLFALATGTIDRIDNSHDFSSLSAGFGQGFRATQTPGIPALITLPGTISAGAG